MRLARSGPLEPAGRGPWPYPGPTGPLELLSSGLCPLAGGDLRGHGARLSPGVACPPPGTFKGALHALSSLPLPSDGNEPAKGYVTQRSSSPVSVENGSAPDLADLNGGRAGGSVPQVCETVKVWVPRLHICRSGGPVW